MKKPYQFKKKKAPSPPDPNAPSLSGTVESVVFRSEETGFTVCSVKISGQSTPATVVGTCQAIWVGESITAQGEWQRHRQHGFQFHAQSIVCVPPSSSKGMERYLASGMIKGIGKVNAGRIVQAFGKDTLHIIEKESKRLEEVEGIGLVRRQLIKTSWDQQKGMRDIMIFLQGHGIGTAQAARIFRHYGGEAVALVRANPYRLCSDVWGIGFKTADNVAMSVGVEQESILRARAGLTHVLQTMTSEGHCFCPEPELLLYATELLDIPAEILAEALQLELNKHRLIKDQDRIYLPLIHQAEITIASRIRALQTASLPFKPIKVDKAIPWAESQMHIQLATMQTEALRTALTEKVSIITGGPGVGKTTIIRALVDILKKRGIPVTLAAPTGRASKRMEEATNHKAQTIHRLLKFTPQTASFTFNAQNQLEAGVFIMDEVSMMDVHLMSALLSALHDRSCLILVGDIDQLPSVGPGNVLRDLIESRSVSCRELEIIFRQETTGLIVQNAHLINSGKPIIVPQAGTESDFYFVPCQDADLAVSNILALVSKRIPHRFGFNPARDIQVLTPMRRNQLGAENLNAVLQNKVNPRGKQVERFGRNYRDGDRVMQIRNNYDKEVFNGDIGRITKVDPDQQQITVTFDNKRVTYDFSEIDELVHSYASTIHKSQGSEFPAVVVVLATQHFKMLQRNLLYTAITRGRQLVCLVGSMKAIDMAIRNNEIKLRRTGLRERLTL